MTSLIGKWFGIEDVSQIHDWQVTFVAPWAQRYPVLLAFGVVALAVLGLIYYSRYQKVSRRGGRMVMAVCRMALLALGLLMLAEPAIRLTLTEHPRPLLLALFDGSESMNIQDHLSDETEQQLAQAVDSETRPESLAGLSRSELVRHVLRGSGKDVFGELAQRYRIRAYLMDRANEVRELDVARPDGSGAMDTAYLGDQLTAAGDVTALGAAFDSLNRRHHGPLLAGVVVFSDFNKNAGPDPVAAARELGAPLFTVGVGPREVVDLSVELQAPLILKKGEKTAVTVLLRHSGLNGQLARVALLARRLGTSVGAESQAAATAVAPAQTVSLSEPQVTLSLPFLPADKGQYVLEATVEPFPGEVLQENNRAEREVTVRDDSLKLFFVEHNPTWEWRFVKEVFHRDPLIGREGFRTFLQSADFKVRRSNPLFVETLVRPRAEFFDNDVILLSDVSGDMISERFQDMLDEYVRRFGGGLVVIAGSNHGLGALKDTRIADMLPVIIDPAAVPMPGPFVLRHAPEAAEADFMNLGADERENRVAWTGLGKLPWFQPVLGAHPLATVLATHPSELCKDESTLQPIIAVRRYGRGEVVYIGFNQLWRLRRLHGEQYYRQFWGQLIYRLGLGRALGAAKRFAVTTDRTVYRAGDQVRVSVEAYNLDFEPLDLPSLSARRLAAPPNVGESPPEEAVSIPLARGTAIYETTFPVYASGRHRLLVRDPATRDEVEVDFTVAEVSVERRSGGRNAALQKALADETGGGHYELHELNALADDVPTLKTTSTSQRRLGLWNTWAMLALVLLLLHTEWITRKLMNLR